MTNWPQINLLRSREAYWRAKDGYRTQEYLKYKATGDRAHFWLIENERKKDWKAVAINRQQILAARTEIAKWESLVKEASHEIWRYEKAIHELLPKVQLWPLGGLVAPGEPYRQQRWDQGLDLEIPLMNAIRAPGPGYVMEYGSDREFPNGFGSPYLIVHIEAGPFHDIPVSRGAAPTWYVGHDNVVLLSPGEHFSTGQPISRANHWLNPGYGWTEWGKYPYGGMGEGYNWKDCFRPVWR